MTWKNGCACVIHVRHPTKSDYLCFLFCLCPFSMLLSLFGGRYRFWDSMTRRLNRNVELSSEQYTLVVGDRLPYRSWWIMLRWLLRWGFMDGFKPFYISFLFSTYCESKRVVSLCNQWPPVWRMTLYCIYTTVYTVCLFSSGFVGFLREKVSSRKRLIPNAYVLILSYLVFYVYFKLKGSMANVESLNKWFHFLATLHWEYCR